MYIENTDRSVRSFVRVLRRRCTSLSCLYNTMSPRKIVGQFLNKM